MPLDSRIIAERLNSIGQTLSNNNDALALLALGSVGLELERLDAYSDLDFFVIVRDGCKTQFIDHLDWLTAAHPLAWHFQNTVDGHKAMMSDGVFCEFAIFELGELAEIPYNPGRFVWRRDEVSESLANPVRALPTPHSQDWLLGEIVSNLVIGLSRLARGEKLAAMRMIQVYALDRLLELIELKSDQSYPIDRDVLRDPFNIDRRIEARCPTLKATLSQIAGGYDTTAKAALAILKIALTLTTIPQATVQQITELAKLSEA
jgi:lincosamide nucleotidyltransferase B/F